MMLPEDFILSADSALREHGTDGHECHLRSAVSRAYYAAFHSAKICAQGVGIQVGGASEHNQLVHALQAHADKDLRATGNRLESLRSKRVVADYKLQMDVQRNDATTAIRGARKLIEQLP